MYSNESYSGPGGPRESRVPKSNGLKDVLTSRALEGPQTKVGSSETLYGGMPDGMGHKLEKPLVGAGAASGIPSPLSSGGPSKSPISGFLDPNRLAGGIMGPEGPIVGSGAAGAPLWGSPGGPGESIGVSNGGYLQKLLEMGRMKNY